MKGRLKILVALSSLASFAASLLYVLSAVAPLWLFRGYVVGYYSLLGYSLRYAHDGQPVLMPHTDHVRHVALTFALLSLTLLALSPIPVLILKRRTGAAAGLAYGVATGLGVLYGLLCGYLYRAMSFDMGRFAFLVGRPNNEVVYRTNAGLITFEGVELEPSLVQNLVFRSPILLVILALAISASSLAAVLALHAAYEHEPKNGDGGGRALQRGSAYAALFLLSFSALASVFTYYPSALAVRPQPPPATLEPPPYGYACTVTRVGRGALAYTDFEAYPLPGWASRGGSWSAVSGVAGAKGNVLYGSDNDGGVGRASQYYYSTDMSARASLWVAVKTRYVSGGKPTHGLYLINSGGNRLFAVEVYRFSAVRGYLEIYSYDVTAAGWVTHASTEITGYSQDFWYSIVAYYSVSGTTISISAYLYDASGALVASASATITHANVFTPAFIGVGVDDGSAYFDEFIISTVDPRGIPFEGLYAGVRVEVWDNLGTLVASGTSTGATLTLGVVHDVVVGTGVDGRIVVRLPDGTVCADHRVPTTDAILGGDSYRVDFDSAPVPVNVTLGVNKTSAIVHVKISGSGGAVTTLTFLRVSSSQPLYARLILESISAPSTLNLDLWLEGAAKSTNVTIRNGVPISTSTSIIPLNLGLANSIVLSGYFTASGQSATLILKLELCTAPGGAGACVYYPITLRPSS